MGLYYLCSGLICLGSGLGVSLIWFASFFGLSYWQLRFFIAGHLFFFIVGLRLDLSSWFLIRVCLCLCSNGLWAHSLVHNRVFYWAWSVLLEALLLFFI